MVLQDKNSHRYDDMIDLQVPTSKKHPRMSLYDRAAQFSPFAALSGHEAAIEETARLTDGRSELDEDAKEQLNRKLQILREQNVTDAEVTFVYFVADEKKSGGEYRSVCGRVKRINLYEQTITLQDQTVIPMEEIREIQGDLFPEFY